MTGETDNHPITPSVVRLLLQTAASKGILRGRREAILTRLTEMGQDIFPDGDNFFSILFSGGERKVAEAAAAPRDIGDAFWRAAFASGERRRLLGSFYTPPAIIDRILDLIWNDLFPKASPPAGDGPTLCDPAMGCGFFLLRTVERLAVRHPDRIPSIREWAENCLFGVDLDAGAVFMARALLWLALSDAKNEFAPRTVNLRQGDSLLGPPFGDASEKTKATGLDWSAAFPVVLAAGGFDLLAGNPPYEVLTNFSHRPERNRLARDLRNSGYYRDSLSGQINLHRCFIERSFAILKPGGVLSFIVPLSLARDASAWPLRRRLLEEHAAEDWIFYDERDQVFPGVTQSACVFRAVKDSGAALALRLESGGESYLMAAADLRKFNASLAIPLINRRGGKLAEWLWEHCPGRLEEAAEMRVGEVDQTVFRDCLLDEDSGCLLVRGRHLSPFFLDLNPAPGRARFLDLPRFLGMKGALAETCRRRAETVRVVQLGIRNMRSRPRLVAALAPPGIYLGNSLNVYTPKNGLPSEYLAGMLNSRLLDWLFRLFSGNNNINLREMRLLPFPNNPAAEHIRKVAEAYRWCAEEAEKGKATDSARGKLDKAVEECYGVPAEFLDGI
ncbi:MAG: N-6 DNA methylase [Planctomycetes bacterium]|nr:N-6 DNA methylase [Planctomycetota bacterium]